MTAWLNNYPLMAQYPAPQWNVWQSVAYRVAVLYDDQLDAVRAEYGNAGRYMTQV